MTNEELVAWAESRLGTEARVDGSRTKTGILQVFQNSTVSPKWVRIRYRGSSRMKYASVLPQTVEHGRLEVREVGAHRFRTVTVEEVENA